LLLLQPTSLNRNVLETYCEMLACTQEPEAGEWKFPGQPGVHINTLFQKKKKKVSVGGLVPNFLTPKLRFKMSLLPS
jgi:hypothetical protein